MSISSTNGPNSTKSPPPIRACLFDMDGLLINTEDIYTFVTNKLLSAHNVPPLPWRIKSQLQGRTTLGATEILLKWANLPEDTMTPEVWIKKSRELQLQMFPSCAPLPGAVELLEKLSQTDMELALATSSNSPNYYLKTGHLGHIFGREVDDEEGEGEGEGELQGGFFKKEHIVRGDDPRIPHGVGKPRPDIYLLALKTINDRRKSEGKDVICPEECLVFEDGAPGVEAGRRAGMRVVWVPHEGLREEYKGKVEEALAAVCHGEDGLEKGEGRGLVGDEWMEVRESLVGFDFERYGIMV